MSAELVVLPSPADVSAAVADRTAEALLAALSTYARASLCVTSGPIFETAYAALGTRRDIAWERVHIFWTHDVAPDQPESAFAMVSRALIDPAGVPEDNVHMIEWMKDADSSARTYESTLELFFGADGAYFDVLHLGIGADGSIAGLAPGSPALAQRDRRAYPARAVEGAADDRVTITLRVINRAEFCVIAATGEEVSSAANEAHRSAGTDPDAAPAGRVQTERPPVWILDEEAAAGLSRS